MVPNSHKNWVDPAKLNWGSEVQGFLGIPRNLAQFPKFGKFRSGIFLGFIPKKPEIRGRGYTSLEVRGGDGVNQKFGVVLGENPRKSLIFGAGTGETISGIFPTLVRSSSKKCNKFVVLESEYIYSLYTTIRCKKYDNFVKVRQLCRTKSTTILLY